MKRFIISIIFSAILMIGCPWLTVEFAGASGMGICFLLFYIVNPLFSAVCGIFAGRNTKQLWPIAFIVSVMFLAGVWIFFDFGEPDFLLYAVTYLFIGMISMLLSYIINKVK